MMASGMPAIATVHSDIPYLFGEYQNRLVPERDADAIAVRLEEYAKDPEKLRSHGVDLSNQIRTKLKVEHRSPLLSDLYDRVKSG